MKKRILVTLGVTVLLMIGIIYYFMNHFHLPMC